MKAEEQNEEKRETPDCSFFPLEADTRTRKQSHAHSNSPPAERTRFGQIIHHPLLSLPPFAVQELNYGDNLALFVVVIITFCNYRSANENTHTPDERCDQAPAEKAEEVNNAKKRTDCRTPCQV